MKSHVKSKIIILIALGVIFVFSPIIAINLNSISGNRNKSSENKEDNNLDKRNLQLSAVSGKIHIANNWTAAKAAGICTGNGTYSEPYVIEDLGIDGGGSGHCILIENSNDFFKIENCTIYNSGANWADSAIKLESVTNGLINNTDFDNIGWGVFLDHSENNTIVGNVFDNERGINMEYSNFNTLYLNDLITNTMDVFTLTDTSNNNLWNSPEPLNYTYNNKNYTSYLGNFWQDYTGPDADTDGIGDNPVVFYDSNRVTMDYYPLKEEVENYEIVGNIELPEIPEGDNPGIPGYSLFVLLGVLSGTVIFISKKLKKS